MLGILSNASVFSGVARKNAADVRTSVRNDWGHCNFDVWTGSKFAKCFQLMETLARSVGLAAAQAKQLLDDLKDWEKKGTVHLKPHQAMHLDPSQAFHCALRNVLRQSSTSQMCGTCCWTDRFYSIRARGLIIVSVRSKRLFKKRLNFSKEIQPSLLTREWEAVHELLWGNMESHFEGV